MMMTMMMVMIMIMIIIMTTRQAIDVGIDISMNQGGMKLYINLMIHLHTLRFSVSKDSICGT